MTAPPSTRQVWRARAKGLVTWVMREIDVGGASDSAAQVAYYALLALFPFMVFLTTLAAYLPLGRAIDAVVARMHALLPGEMVSILDQQLHHLLSSPRPKLLTIGILVTFWSASRATDAVRASLNRAYRGSETRPYWKTQVVALVVTLAGAVLGLVSVALLNAGGSAGYWLANRLDLSTEYLFVLHWLRWPITAGFIMLVAALAYYFLPAVEQSFRYITPGSVLCTIAWLLATRGFGLYADHFGSYDVTYGSIGGVAIMLTWLYISAWLFLLGGEINAARRRAILAQGGPAKVDEGAART